jgi:hypothetical protein
MGVEANRYTEHVLPRSSRDRRRLSGRGGRCWDDMIMSECFLVDYHTCLEYSTGRNISHRLEFGSSPSQDA